MEVTNSLYDRYDSAYSRHSKETIYRAFYVALSAIFTFCCSYCNADKLIHFLAAPLEKAHDSLLHSRPPFSFIFTEVTEALSAYVQVSMFLTMWSSIFFVSYQIWSFVKPGLYPHERSIFISCFLTPHIVLSVLIVLVT